MSRTRSTVTYVPDRLIEPTQPGLQQVRYKSPAINLRRYVGSSEYSCDRLLEHVRRCCISCAMNVTLRPAEDRGLRCQRQGKWHIRRQTARALPIRNYKCAVGLSRKLANFAGRYVLYAVVRKILRLNVTR